MRKLPPASTEKPAKRPEWSSTQAALFACGLVVAIGAAGVAGFFLWQRRDLVTQEPEFVGEMGASYVSNVDEFSAEEAWTEFLELQATGPGLRQKPPWELNKEASDALLLNAMIAAGVMAAGIGAVVGSIVLPLGKS